MKFCRRGGISLGILCFIAVALLLPSSTHAAGAVLYFSPSTGNKLVGETFSVTVRLNTGGNAVNAAEGSIVFEVSKLQVTSISKAGSVFSLWTTEPTYSNSDGTIEFGGGLPNPGYTGSNGTVLIINFKTKSATTISGNTDIVLVSGAVLANDGQGTNILSSLGRASFFIGPTTTTPTVEQSDEQQQEPVISSRIAAPVITSKTNPDSGRWYPIRNPVLMWDVPQGTSEVRLSLTKTPKGNPLVVYRPPISEKTLDTLEDGVWYFHARFLTSQGLGPISDYKLQVDATPPQPFTIIRQNTDDATEPQPELLFTAVDATSGIDHYEVAIGSTTISVSAEEGSKPYRLPPQIPGSYEVVAKAFDRAGNVATATTTLSVESIPRPALEVLESQVSRGQVIKLRGTTQPNSEVVVRIYGGNPLSASIFENRMLVRELRSRADAAGLWEIHIEDLKPGAYRAEAHAIDARGAISIASEPVDIQVNSAFMGQIVEFLKWLVRSWAGLLLLALLYAVVTAAILYRHFSHRKNTRAKIGAWEKLLAPFLLKHEQTKVAKNLRHLTDDMRQELELLKKISKHRQLYPEEQYLSAKLNQYLKTLKIFEKK